MNRNRYRFSLPFGIWLMVTSAVSAQTVDPLQHRGTVKSIAANGDSFVLTERRTGVDLTVSLSANTRYVLGGNDRAAFIDVVRVGERVLATLDSKGVAIEVQNKNSLGRPTAAELKRGLDVTDEEVAALMPLITRALQARRDLSEAYQSGNGDDQQPDPAEMLKRALRSANATPTDIRTLVSLLRKQRTQLQQDLKRASDDLTSVLTVRQEAELVQMGILD